MVTNTAAGVSPNEIYFDTANGNQILREQQQIKPIRNCLIAVKTYDKEKYDDPVFREMIKQEISNLRILRHCTGVIRLRGIY